MPPRTRKYKTVLIISLTKINAYFVQTQWCMWDYLPIYSLEPGTATRLEALLPICPSTSSWKWTSSPVLGQVHLDRPPCRTQSSRHCLVVQTCQAYRDHRHRRPSWQEHPPDLYNQDPKVWSVEAWNHSNVKSEIDHRSLYCDFTYKERACKVHESTERSWRGQGTCGSPESSIIEYLPHSPFLPRSSERMRPTTLNLW